MHKTARYQLLTSRMSSLRYEVCVQIFNPFIIIIIIVYCKGVLCLKAYKTH